MDDTVTTFSPNLSATTTTSHQGNTDLGHIINNDSDGHAGALMSSYPSSILRRRNYHHRHVPPKKTTTTTRSRDHISSSSGGQTRNANVKKPLRFHVPSSVPPSLGFPSLSRSPSQAAPSFSRPSSYSSSLAPHPCNSTRARARTHTRTRTRSRSRSQSPLVGPCSLSLHRCSSSPSVAGKPTKTGLRATTRKTSKSDSSKPCLASLKDVASAVFEDSHGHSNGADGGDLSVTSKTRPSSTAIRRSATTHAGMMANHQRNRRTRIKRITSDRVIPAARSRHSHRSSLDPPVSSSSITTGVTSSGLNGHRSIDVDISNDITMGTSPHVSLSASNESVRRTCPSRSTRRWVQDRRSQPVSRPSEGELDGVFSFLQSCKNVVFNFFRGIPAFFSGISRIASSFIRGFTPAIQRSSPSPSS